MRLKRFKRVLKISQMEEKKGPMELEEVGELIKKTEEKMAQAKEKLSRLKEAKNKTEAWIRENPGITDGGPINVAFNSSGRLIGFNVNEAALTHSDIVVSLGNRQTDKESGFSFAKSSFGVQNKCTCGGLMEPKEHVDYDWDGLTTDGVPKTFHFEQCTMCGKKTEMVLGT